MAAPLTLVLLGDIMLGRYVNDGFTCDSTQKTAAFGNVLPFLHSLDPASTVVAGNLECAVTSHAVRNPKAFNFKLSPSNADVLQQLRLSFVATANNHVLDYGQQGLRDTMQELDRVGVKHAGCGKQPAASQPAVVTTAGGHRVAFLSYSDHYEDWAATHSTAGINFIDPAKYDLGLLQRQVAAARAAGADLVVVMVHWGPNWRWQPDKHLRDLGRAFLAAGADLVFGTSPHHIQGVELVGHKAIIYSGGSFIDDYSGDDHFRNDLSAIMVATFVPSSSKAHATPGAAITPSSTAAAAAAAKGQHGHDEQRKQSVGSRTTASNAASLQDQQRSVAAAPAPKATAGSMMSVGAAARSAAPATPPTAKQARAGVGHGPAASTVASIQGHQGGWQLQQLVARPIAITHLWRTEGGPFKEEGGGNPAYFSQVNFAEGADRDWVAFQLQQLSGALGNAHVHMQPSRQEVLLL